MDNPSISLALPLQSVNYVLQVLAERPYREVNGLVKSITDQAQAQLQPPEKADPVEGPGRPE
ncbi:MAG: hypothetical protein HY856_13515 [Burkholderiales bacterium]|nr:hypothetical protein [Burkholderiales bacterium]